jgi:hypothetical protein
MLYLILLLVAGEIALLYCIQKLMQSARKRHKTMDSQLHNLHQWMLTYQQALVKQLEQLTIPANQPVNTTAVVKPAITGSQPAIAYTETSLTVMMQSAHKEALEKMKQQQWQQYYTLLLQELQQTGYQPVRNELTADAGKKDNTGKMNGHRLQATI